MIRSVGVDGLLQQLVDLSMSIKRRGYGGRARYTDRVVYWRVRSRAVEGVSRFAKSCHHLGLGLYLILSLKLRSNLCNSTVRRDVIVKMYDPRMRNGESEEIAKEKITNEFQYFNSPSFQKSCINFGSSKRATTASNAERLTTAPSSVLQSLEAERECRT